MNTQRILATTIASLVLTLTSYALTDTWDGGGADNNLSTALNWADNTAPVSDLVNTDLIFAGAVRLTPNVSAALSTNSITFNNTAGAFVIGGTTLTIGGGGIVNSDADTQVFGAPVSIGVASTAFNAAGGALSFTNTVALGTSALVLNGGSPFSFRNFSGTGTLTKNSTGTMTWTPNLTTGIDFAIQAGTVNTVADGSTDIFSPTASIAVNGTSTFNMFESVTLDGAQLTRALNAGLSLATGKTLTVSNGGDVIVTGAFNRTTASTVTLNGAGATLSATAFSDFSGGSITNVLNGAGLTITGAGLRIGNGSDGTLNVDGAVSTAAASFLNLGESGGTGLATFANGSVGTFSGTLSVGNNSTAGTSGTLNVASGASVSGGAVTIGHTSLPTAGTVAITSGGTFTATGTLLVNGLLTRDATSNLGLPFANTVTVQNGGDIQIAGDMNLDTGATVTVTGAGSTLAVTGGALRLHSDEIVNVLAGADVSASGAVDIGTSGAGTLLVNAAGSTLTAGSPSNWGVGALADVTFSNGASGNMAALHLANSNTAGSAATLSVISGATLGAGVVSIGAGGGGTSASATIGGVGSAFTQSGAVNLTVGGANSTGTLTVQNGATFTSGTGNTTVGALGTITINGSTYNANGNATLNGGDLNVNASGAFLLAASKNFTVQSGSAAAFASSLVFISSNTITITGAGSSLIQTGGANLTIAGGSSVSVLAGGTLSNEQYIDVGTVSGGSGVLLADGAGSSVTTSSSTSFWGGSGGSALVEFRNNATGSMGTVAMPAHSAGSTGSLLISSGADVTMGDFLVANTAIASTGTVTITGAGSTLTLNGSSTFALGAASASTATMNVNTGATFTSSTGAVLVNPTGTLNIGGGNVTLLGFLTQNGTLNFTSGRLSIINNWNVGAGGLLGPNVTLDATRRMTTSATTTIDAFQTLTLNGGTLTTAALVNNGAIDFQKGTLAVTGVSGFTIGGGGGLGSNVVLGLGANLQVTNTATLATGAALTLNDGTFTAGILANAGTLRANLGTASAASGTNQSGGRIFIGDTFDIPGAFTNASGARIVLEGGSGLLSGAGALTNNGLLTGSGTVTKPLTNSATGEVRADFTQTLNFTAAATNSAAMNLVGGALDFSSTLTNAATGFISGHGALFTNGLTNNGNVAISGGNADIRGDVTNAAGARIVTSGGATTTFFDDVVHNGTEIRTSAGGSSVFLGAVSGAGPFTGTGTVYFEGDLRPGNSPASVLYEGDLVFGGGASLTLEIGGLLSGAQHDHLNVGGALRADGDLVLALLGGFTPQFGDTFDLLDVGTFTGDFDSISAPALGGGNAWDFSNLKTTGAITVVPEPGVATLVTSAFALLGLRRRRSH